MTELQTLIKENASLIRELKYNVKEKQKAIDMLLEQLSREGEKVFELVEAFSMAVQALKDHNIDESMAGEFEILTDALAKVEGK